MTTERGETLPSPDEQAEFAALRATDAVRGAAERLSEGLLLDAPLFRAPMRLGRGVAMSAEPRMAALVEVAARLWPGPDPVDFLKREAIRHLAELDRALNQAIELRTSADELVFPELSRLWIHPTRLEALLSLLQAGLAAAAGHTTKVLDLLVSARAEADLRTCEERLLERAQRGA